LFTLTNGFTDFDAFTKGKVEKEKKKGLRKLDDLINGSRRNPSGGLELVSGVKSDPESYLGKGYSLDL